MKTSIRSKQVSVRSHRCGNAAGMGQGVQPLPPERHPPQRVREGRGEPNPVGPRQRARRPQAPSGVWGRSPGAERKRGYLRWALAQPEWHAKRARAGVQPGAAGQAALGAQRTGRRSPRRR